MEGLKSNMKMNLPIITDVTEEDINEPDTEPEKSTGQRNGYQPLSTINSSREIIDLSPIYENSSDACSSHDDLRDSDNDTQKSTNLLNSDCIESSSVTPNSMSQTHSEHSMEMGKGTDSLKICAKRKKHVNIVSDIVESESVTEITALRGKFHGSQSPEGSLRDSKEGYLTMAGTIKRGKKKGRKVDVTIDISREELDMIETAIAAEVYNKLDLSKFSKKNGPHIFLFTLLCIPIVACISALYSFYMGTMTWYNIFTHVTEDFNWIRKALLSPIVIMMYPFLIVTLTIGLGLYAGIVQVTSSSSIWWKEVCDLEKGFYGWFCNAFGLSACCPYEVVVILMDMKK